ncbi:hypothetical protein PR048_022108 [Dryococelus australis]|uniref:Uncharacterized protein n=1 Tax=Dryococelus australis TaxID=614101 RepID=A0ABQ9H037_9NEOP|nr:hypothetical protein PR048_022108 [Dryococelus australis]
MLLLGGFSWDLLFPTASTRRYVLPNYARDNNFSRSSFVLWNRHGRFFQALYYFPVRVDTVQYIRPGLSLTVKEETHQQLKALVYLEIFSALVAEGHRSDKDDTALSIKCAIATKRKALVEGCFALPHLTHSRRSHCLATSLPRPNAFGILPLGPRKTLGVRHFCEYQRRDELEARFLAAFETIKNTPAIFYDVLRNMLRRCRICIECGGNNSEQLLSREWSSPSSQTNVVVSNNGEFSAPISRDSTVINPPFHGDQRSSTRNGVEVWTLVAAVDVFSGVGLLEAETATKAKAAKRAKHLLARVDMDVFSSCFIKPPERKFSTLVDPVKKGRVRGGEGWKLRKDSSRELSLAISVPLTRLHIRVSPDSAYALLRSLTCKDCASACVETAF